MTQPMTDPTSHPQLEPTSSPAERVAAFAAATRLGSVIRATTAEPYSLRPVPPRSNPFGQSRLQEED